MQRLPIRILEPAMRVNYQCRPSSARSANQSTRPHNGLTLDRRLGSQSLLPVDILAYELFHFGSVLMSSNEFVSVHSMLLDVGGSKTSETVLLVPLSRAKTFVSDFLGLAIRVQCSWLAAHSSSTALVSSETSDCRLSRVLKETEARPSSGFFPP